MTGFGSAQNQDERLNVAVEVRTVNNRYLKISSKCPDTYANLENRIEKAIRESISRGMVTLVVRTDRIGDRQKFTIARDVLEAYWGELSQLSSEFKVLAPTDLSRLLGLPGVVMDQSPSEIDCETDWPTIRKALVDSLKKLREFRIEEGRSMQQELQLNCRVVANELDQVQTLAPQVVENYRDRLQERVNDLLEKSNVSLDRSDLIREITIFSDRCDINEEITRLRCHLDQFSSFLNEETSQGRKLEFLSQEIFREVNTIGAKANDATIAHHVVEMKFAIEKIREILQNVE